MSRTPNSGIPTPGSNSSSGSPATGSNSSSTESPTPTPGSNSSSGSPSPPSYPGSMFSVNESRPSSPHAPPFNNKQAPAPSTDPTPATPASPPADSGSSPLTSPSPPPPQQSAPPTPTPATTPPPPQATTTPQVSPPPVPVSSTSPPPSAQSPPASNPPQQTSPPSSGSSPPTGQLPTPNSPPTNQTPVVPSPYSPPSPAGSGPPSPMVPSPPNSTPSPPGFSSSGSSSTPTSPGSNSPPSTGSSPTEGSGSSSSPKSGSTPHSSHHHSNSSSTNSPTLSMSTTGLAIGGAVAGVIIIAVIAMLFVFCKRKKRRVGTFAPQYIPPNSFPKSDGYYYGQKAQPKESFYASQMQHSPARINGSYGNPGMNGYSGGPYSGGGYSGGGYSGPDSDVIGGGKSFFSYEEVMEITNRFSRQNVIGEGGFGYVYKGQLADGKLVAVKQLKAGGGQGDREFRAEVEIISRVHHRHLVSLVGYSIAEDQRLLIYEFVPNKTLEHHLHGKEMPLLDWSKRVKIALGSAKGLAYLHEDCHPKIIHRDIKSSNILLDDAFEAQVADFGLAKITMDTNTHVSTRVMGTFGYLAPEYATSGKLTDRSDVFSFGVVLLELITGRKPVDPSRPLGDESLVEWVRTGYPTFDKFSTIFSEARPLLIHTLETGDFSELVDPRLERHYVESEMIRMIEAAAACIRHNASKRPRMAQVVRALDNGGEMSDLTNGVKFGQSTAYDSGQYNEDIKRFNRMVHGEYNSSDYGTYSGDYTSKEVPSETTQSSWKSRDTSEFTSGELETKAINPERQTRMGQEVYRDRRFK